MKNVIFLGGSKSDLSGFPEAARQTAGYELFLIQAGLEPSDWKPMASVGPGVREIRVRDAAGAFRVIYVANIGDAVYVLHAFQKKSQQTSRQDLDLAKARLKQIR